MKNYIKIAFIIIITISHLIYAKPSDKIRFSANELTKLEYDFFTKIDNGETNDLELHYDGFIIASGITDEDEFKDQFKDKNVEQFFYTKTGESGDNMIDAISGATITTNAVTNAVDSALVYFQNELGGEGNE